LTDDNVGLCCYALNKKFILTQQQLEMCPPMTTSAISAQSSRDREGGGNRTGSDNHSNKGKSGGGTAGGGTAPVILVVHPAPAAPPAVMLAAIPVEVIRAVATLAGVVPVAVTRAAATGSAAKTEPVFTAELSQLNEIMASRPHLKLSSSFRLRQIESVWCCPSRNLTWFDLGLRGVRNLLPAVLREIKEARPGLGVSGIAGPPAGVNQLPQSARMHPSLQSAAGSL
jgi:hypothetical protein